MIRYELKNDEITGALERVAAALTDMTSLMDDIGDDMVKSTEDNFNALQAPDGTPWAPKSQATLDAYARRGIGHLTRPLHGNSLALSTTINYQAGPDSVSWGSNVIQAAVMQLGARKGEFGTASNGSSIPWGDIPARPYIGIGEEDQVNILAATERYLRTASEG